MQVGTIKPVIKWYLPITHKQTAHLIERVENIEVQINYDIKYSMLGVVGDFDIWVIQVVDQQLKSEETNLVQRQSKQLKN